MIFFFQAEDGIRDVAVTGVQTCALPISPESHQRSWWIVHTQPTKGLGAHPSRIPPTQLVDRSYSAYKGTGRAPLPNPTNAVGGSFILSLQWTGGRAVPNRTDVVRGLVILSIETGLGWGSRQCM